ncbi:MAG: hypothetical protein QME64_06240, partial [bacterium]|nr:hypothetical protein [bacterium]
MPISLSKPSINGFLYRSAYLILCGLFTAIIFSIFLLGYTVNERAMLGDMVYGKAHKPFVYRTLIPTTVKITTAVIPIAIKNEITQFAKKYLTTHPELRKLDWMKQLESDEYLVESFIGLILMYLSLFGFVFALRYCLTGMFSAPCWFNDIVPVTALFGLLPFFNYGYLYDFTTLLLFTLALGLMVRNLWYPYLLVYFLSCLNKETTILLTLIFIPYYLERNRMERRLFKNLLFAQLGIYLLVKCILVLIFWNNPGSMVEFNIFVNAIRVELQFERAPVVTLSSLLGITFLVFYRWIDKPIFLKYSLWIFLPFFLLYLLFGDYGEWRVFYGVYPIFILASAHSIAALTGIK